MSAQAEGPSRTFRRGAAKSSQSPDAWSGTDDARHALFEDSDGDLLARRVRSLPSITSKSGGFRMLVTDVLPDALPEGARPGVVYQ